MRLSFLGVRTKTSYAQLVVQFYSRSVVSLFSHVVNLLTFSFTDFAIKRIAFAIVYALFLSDYNVFRDKNSSFLLHSPNILSTTRRII